MSPRDPDDRHPDGGPETERDRPAPADPDAGSEDFASLLAEYEASQPAAGPGRRGPAVGDVVSGRVVSIGRDAIFIDLGGKAEGMLEREQVTDPDGRLEVEVGDEVEARVADTDSASGCIVLRRSVGRGPAAAEELAQAAELGLPVEGLVTAVNKGGVEVQIATARGFCPISQLDTSYVEDPESFVGQRLRFRVERVEGGRRANVVLSRRALLEQEAARQAEETRRTLEVGATVSGAVTRVMPYGAFVDLGGLEGMIHVSELGHGRTEHPSDVLAEGQRVTARVLRIEPAEGKRKERIALSLKALERDPWDDVATRFPEGARVTGTVTRAMPYGAFVEVAPGVEGLVHISELGAGRRIQHPREVVASGQQVEARVLSVDPGRRRLSLSLAEAPEAEAPPAEEAPAASAPASLGTLGDLLKNKLGR